MRALCFVFFALLGCSRESASPSPSPSGSPGPEGGAPSAAQSGAVAPSQACVSAKVSLETLLVSLPKRCNSASDCDGYYLRPSACEAAVILPKPGVPPERQAALEGLQAEARRACPPDKNACSPRPFRAECRASRCIDALAPAAMP
jgi:hypothetical protein